MSGFSYIKHLVLTVGAVLLLAGTLTAVVVNATENEVNSQNSYQSSQAVMSEMTVLTNELRAKNGLLPLAEDANLENSAKQKLTDMNEKKYWGHYAPDGTKFSDFIWGEKPNAVTVGENLAKCFTTTSDAFEGFVNSPTHYAILVGDFKNIGIAKKIDNNNCQSIVMHVSK